MSQALVKAQASGFLQINPIKLRDGWQLKKLTDKHRTIIALHAQSVKREDIAKIAGCTPEYVSMIVKQPLAQEYLAELEQYTDARLKATFTKAVDAIEDALDSGDDEVRLKAARLSLEATGKMKGDRKDSRTAEDVVSAILQNATLIIGQNVQVNQGG